MDNVAKKSLSRVLISPFGKKGEEGSLRNGSEIFDLSTMRILNYSTPRKRRLLMQWPDSFSCYIDGVCVSF